MHNRSHESRSGPTGFAPVLAVMCILASVAGWQARQISESYLRASRAQRVDIQVECPEVLHVSGAGTERVNGCYTRQSDGSGPTTGENVWYQHMDNPNVHLGDTGIEWEFASLSPFGQYYRSRGPALTGLEKPTCPQAYTPNEWNTAPEGSPPGPTVEPGSSPCAPGETRSGTIASSSDATPDESAESTGGGS